MATSVIHPSTPIGNPIMTDRSVIDQFGGMATRLAPGQVSVPTQLRELSYNDKNFKNLEKPIFIHKGQTNLENKNNNKHRPLQGKKLGNTVQKEAVGGMINKLNTVR
jgi:hypothetical protein